MNTHSSNAQHRQGFTLVELLVVISIIAMLIAILMPSLSKARDQAKAVVCATRLKGILTGMSVYAAEHKDYIVGSPSTSGSALFGREAGLNPMAFMNAYPFNPVQVWDFAGGMARSMNINYSTRPWAERFNTIRTMKAFSCPSNKFKAGPYTPAFDAGIGPMVSYNTVRYFMYPSTKEDMMNSFPNPVTGRGTHPRWGRGVGWIFRSRELNAYYDQGQDINRDEIPRRGYIPRTDLVGSLSDKVFVADGSRFSGTAGDEKPDYDGNIYAKWGGAFSDVGPYSAEYSRSWSRVAAGAGGDPRIINDPRTWSYRHGKKQPFLPLGNYKMNVGFFDNHVDTMNDIDSANPHLWMPKGFRLKRSESVAADVLEKYFRPEDTYIEIR